MKYWLLNRIVPVLGTALLHLNILTLRKEILGRNHVEQAVRSHGSVIYALWHGRFWLPAALFGFEHSALLVSRSRDGEMIASVAERLGYTTVRGSSSRGGSEALIALQDCLEAGHNVAITPDGPKGPREEAKLGAVILAARSGHPIIPVGASGRPAHHFNSWDQFQLPHVFARGAVVFGAPLMVDAVVPAEKSAGELALALGAVQRQADSLVGRC